MANNTGTFFNINDNDGIPLVGVSTDGKVMINHLYGNCLIGSTSVTGTSSQPLQVSGGAYVSGNLGVGNTNPTSKLHVVGNGNFTGVVTATTFFGAFTGTASSTTNIPNLTGDITSNGTTTSIAAGVIIDADVNASAAISLSKLATTGILTATSFVGALTGTATTATNAQGLTGTPNITVGIATATSFVGTASTIFYTSEWILGANGTSDYTFTGPGLIGAENDPTLYLIRGQRYEFTNTMDAHPFRIQSTVNGSTGTQYNDGVVNNDVSNGTLTWDVQFDAPNLLYYQCTVHPDMGGKIYIIDAGIGSDVSINTSGISTFSGGINVGTGGTVITTTSAGSVGIGTTNPEEKLSVYGAVESLTDSIGEGGHFILRGKPETPIRWNIDNYSVGLTTNLFRIFKEDNSTRLNGRVYVGITTIGEFIIGDGAGALSPTGTANQQLQVQSSAYIQNNLGIGTINPTSKLQVVGGDIRVGVNTSQGVILTSANGTKFRILVSDSGVLSTVLVS